LYDCSAAGGCRSLRGPRPEQPERREPDQERLERPAVGRGVQTLLPRQAAGIERLADVDRVRDEEYPEEELLRQRTGHVPHPEGVRAGVKAEHASQPEATENGDPPRQGGTVDSV